jgi:hypothetical protein
VAWARAFAGPSRHRRRAPVAPTTDASLPSPGGEGFCQSGPGKISIVARNAHLFSEFCSCYSRRHPNDITEFEYKPVSLEPATRFIF